MNLISVSATEYDLFFRWFASPEQYQSYKVRIEDGSRIVTDKDTGKIVCKDSKDGSSYLINSDYYTAFKEDN